MSAWESAQAAFLACARACLDASLLGPLASPFPHGAMPPRFPGRHSTLGDEPTSPGDGTGFPAKKSRSQRSALS
jgi:hypothetical protein